MSHNPSASYHSNAYSAESACLHCEGIVRHEPWCLIGADGKIGELVQKALAGAGHEIVKVGHKSGDFQVEIENRESVRKLYQAVGSFDAVAIAAASPLLQTHGHRPDH
jgi:hypothetical protein